MDNRLRFLYPYICEGMTERGSCSQRLEELVQARYRDGRQIHHPKREGVKRTESYGEYGRQWRNFQEKFLTKVYMARTENGHTWVRRES